MAHKCRASDANPWKTKLNDEDDGDLTIGREAGDGRIRGRHKGEELDAAGQCFEESGDQPDKIILWLPPHNPTYLYYGVITTDPNGDLHITGKRQDLRFVEGDSERRRLLDDDEWTGTKGT